MVGMYLIIDVVSQTTIIMVLILIAVVKPVKLIMLTMILKRR